MSIISKETPLSEITLRKYEKPPEKTEKRELIRKLCLSLGLLNPGDSRDIIVDLLCILTETKEPINSEIIQQRVIDLRKNKKLPLKGIAPSNIRRQLKRLRDLFLIEKIKNNYRITENESLLKIFEEKIEKFYLDSITSRIKDYLNEL
jgi:hypothetical protein